MPMMPVKNPSMSPTTAIFQRAGTFAVRSVCDPNDGRLNMDRDEITIAVANAVMRAAGGTNPATRPPRYAPAIPSMDHWMPIFQLVLPERE